MTADDRLEPTPASRPDLAMAQRLSGRAAIVTGAARGIGAAIADRLAAEGARVAVLDLDGAGAAAVAERIGGYSVTVDLADPGTISPAVGRAVDALGGLDILVNNAGTFAKAPIAEVDLTTWERVMAVNTTAVLLTMQAALGPLGRSGRGRIVNIASMAARRGTPGEGAYAASKAAVVALTRVAALELGAAGTTVNAVCPGYVLTDLGAQTRTADDVTRWTAQSPLRRLATVEDVAAAVAFLASDDGAYLTGQALDVSGGMIMA